MVAKSAKAALIAVPFPPDLFVVLPGIIIRDCRFNVCSWQEQRFADLYGGVNEIQCIYILEYASVR